MTQTTTVDGATAEALKAAGWSAPREAKRADVLVTVPEACEQLGIGKTKFYDLINKGELTVVDISPRKPEGPRRIGEKGHRRVLRVEQAEINRFKTARTVSA